MQEMTRLILPSMCERGEKGKRPECCLINVSSLSAMLTVPLMTVYSASKAYVTTFTAALATEYSGKVCIMSVEPGTARTEMCFNKYEGIGNPHPRSVAKGALDFAGCALTSFTPHYFHQARPAPSPECNSYTYSFYLQLQRFGLKFIPIRIKTLIAKKTFEMFREALVNKKC
jgi:hypothetical protein